MTSLTCLTEIYFQGPPTPLPWYRYIYTVPDTIVTILGASSTQLQSHYGWKSPNMAMEYVTKSRAAIKDVAELLARGEDKEEVFIDTPTVFVL